VQATQGSRVEPETESGVWLEHPGVEDDWDEQNGCGEELDTKSLSPNGATLQHQGPRRVLRPFAQAAVVPHRLGPYPPSKKKEGAAAKVYKDPFFLTLYFFPADYSDNVPAFWSQLMQIRDRFPLRLLSAAFRPSFSTNSTPISREREGSGISGWGSCRPGAPVRPPRDLCLSPRDYTAIDVPLMHFPRAPAQAPG